jgi:nucleoside-diphosphate-sugar epimerase
MKTLVTGGTGVTGSALVRRLLGEGRRVIVLDNKEGYKTGELRSLGAEIVIGTVTDAATVARCMEGVEIVHHVAAAFREMHLPDREYAEINIEGTRIVAEAALKQGVRKFVYCSTCGVHGDVRHPPATEDSPIAPSDYYQRTKYEGELVTLACHQRGLPSTILRPNAIYGPGDPGRYYMIFRRVRKGTFPMFGSGKTLYHSLYIDNLIDAFMLAESPDRGLGQAYLIADEHYVEIEDLVRRVARAMGTAVRIPHYPVWPLIVIGHVVEKACKPFGIAPPIFPRRVDWFRLDRAFDIGKARRELGYRPAVDLDEGLRRTYAWYVAEGML